MKPFIPGNSKPTGSSLAEHRAALVAAVSGRRGKRYLKRQRSGAVIHLALCAWPSLDNRSSLRRRLSAKLANEALHTLVAAREPMPVDQVLEDTRRVTTT